MYVPLSLNSLVSVSPSLVPVSIYRERAPSCLSLYNFMKNQKVVASTGLPSSLVLRGLLRVLVLVHFRNRSVCASDFAHPGVAFVRVG